MSSRPGSRKKKNIRAIILVAALLVGAAITVARQRRPSFLPPGLRLNAYVTTQDGNVNVIDLVNLRSVASVPVGPALPGLREHPTRPEIWGVSTQDGYVFVLGALADQVIARIPVGPAPYALEFSPDGSIVYTTSSGSDRIVAINAETHAVVGSAQNGRPPVLARLAPDKKTLVVLNHDDATLGVYDASTLAHTATI